MILKLWGYNYSRYCSWKLAVKILALNGDYGKLLNLEQGQKLNNQLSHAISAEILPIEPQDQQQPIHKVPVNGSNCKHDLEVPWVKLKQILQLQAGCFNFGPVWDSAIYHKWNVMLVRE